MDRREFLKGAAGAAAALGIGGTTESLAASGGLATRKLGKTGRRVSIIGFGGIVLLGHEQEEANRIVSEATDQGVTYFDVAPSYGNGEAEEKLGPALEPYRQRVFLACKTGRRDKKGAEEELNRSLARLKTDHFDTYQLHGLTRMEELDQSLSDDGALKTFEAAKKDGRIRAIGFSAHSAEVALAAMDRYPFDTILFPVNFVLFHQANFGPQVLKKAKEKGVGFLALKSMAHQPWPKDAKREYPNCWYQPISDEATANLSVRFTLSQLVAAAVPPGDLRLWRIALKAALNYKPLAKGEQETLRKIAETSTPIFRLGTA
jgi:aryl-alcohol dehydrogenase-like predicted oxidoreductase